MVRESSHETALPLMFRFLVDIFLPAPENLLVNLKENKEVRVSKTKY
jgi:hypothetical protein